MIHRNLCACRDCYALDILEGLLWLIEQIGWREWHSAYYCDGNIPSVFVYSGSAGDCGALRTYEEWQQIVTKGISNAEQEKI